MLMALFWLVLLGFALIWPHRVWKDKPVSFRMLAGIGIFLCPLGVAAIADGVAGGVYILVAGWLATRYLQPSSHKAN